MGRPRKWKSDAERKRAQRSGELAKRQAQEAIEAASENTDSPETPVNRPLTPEEEQGIRDSYGYSDTEKRSKAERDEAARRMLVKSGYEPSEPMVLAGGRGEYQGKSLDYARKMGRVLGTEEASRRGETGAKRQARIERAILYAELQWAGYFGG